MLVLQNLVLSFADDAADLAMAGHGAIFNVGIGSGALIGSLFSEAFLEKLTSFGASIVLLSLVLCGILLKKTRIIEVTGRVHS